MSDDWEFQKRLSFRHGLIRTLDLFLISSLDSTSSDVLALFPDWLLPRRQDGCHQQWRLQSSLLLYRQKERMPSPRAIEQKPKPHCGWTDLKWARECTYWFRSALPPLPGSVSVWYKRRNYAKQGPPWNWDGVNGTQTRGCYKVRVGWFPKGELPRKRRQLLPGMQPTSAHYTPMALGTLYQMMCIYVRLSNSS